ncbi:MAG: hypothetical protein H7645_01985 [Candidatus Heimdallarchaeota archaeon]|nr:hypothetical protein [Candidatus Heimdallarchaeota archaeon]MCK4769088.1 hypothetical protein [Candidatus Heimdallarchaeota archaeon]
MKERTKLFSPRMIGLALIISILINILTRSIVYSLSYRARLKGIINLIQFNTQSSTTYYSMWYLVNLLILGLLFGYFFFNREGEEFQKEHRIGFISSLIASVLFIVSIILFIIAEVQMYSLLIKPGIMKSQLAFNIAFFVSFFIVLVIYWKITFVNKSVNSVIKILSISLLVFGFCVFLIALDQIELITILSFTAGTASMVTVNFFEFIFANFYAVSAVIAGTTMLLTSKQKDDLS